MAKTFNEEAVTNFFTTLTPDVAGEVKKEQTLRKSAGTGCWYSIRERDILLR